MELRFVENALDIRDFALRFRIKNATPRRPPRATAIVELAIIPINHPAILH